MQARAMLLIVCISVAFWTRILWFVFSLFFSFSFYFPLPLLGLMLTCISTVNVAGSHLECQQSNTTTRHPEARLPPVYSARVVSKGGTSFCFIYHFLSICDSMYSFCHNLLMDHVM